MNGIHINWTAPFKLKHTGEYFIEDFELLTTILSALKWKEKNGKIKLCADETAMKYYDKMGILGLYNETENVEVDNDIDPQMFWAAGKLFALKDQKAPVAMIDTDFIVWDEILFDKLGECTVIHFEELYPDVYPGRSGFSMRKDYEWPDLNWELPACNTAFTVIKSQQFIDYYTDTAIKFMKYSENTGDPLKYMVFAEQRLINMCAEKLGIEVRAFSHLARLFEHGEKCFTHIWGMKQQMRDMPWLRRDFCLRCAARIRREYPEYAHISDKIVEKYRK